MPAQCAEGQRGGPASDHFTPSAGCVDTAPDYTNTLQTDLSIAAMSRKATPHRPPDRIYAFV